MARSRVSKCSPVTSEPLASCFSPDRREKYRKLKEQRAAQGKETLEEHEEEMKSHANLYDKKIREIEM